ncbi:MAG: ABC transporter permease [Sulfobacillus thermosulfidooxidans]|uniref:Cell division protein FtsX n=1 Tax=Sulfobacillus thermotolerans TaxID=338644 RepID=A0ABN5H854_9FIRM|nr:permease-like cell division protein FtsX [Sulfobacillus sp. hq2]AUW95483.1 cell division protein [Sulfobacillus thermotolerans]POB11976.1 cell division protein [Sulfobacillus sp. hq2]PSR37305.1 MAG: ABC transporter permease [Sulfobacillus thermosulfidooxidans]
MSLNSVWYITKETGRNLVYNTWMTLASVSTVAISMFVLSFFLVLTVNMNHLTTVLQNQVEMRVFINTNVPRSKEMALLNEADKWPGVRKIQFFTKQQAAESLKREFPDQRDLLTLIAKSNPLFDGFNVYTKNPAEIPALAVRFQHQKVVHNVVYEGQVVRRLSRLSIIMKWVGWVVELLLGLATLFIIINTIRLAVFARRREVAVMKLVGATDWFIRWPFILEGLVLGLVGAGIADVVVAQGYHWLVAAAAGALPFWPMAPYSQVMGKTVDFTLGGGLLVGGLASMVALRRFLRV